MTFKTYCIQVDFWCRKLFGTSWADLCGDIEPLQHGQAQDLPPEAFARWWGERYGLDFLENDRWY